MNKILKNPKEYIGFDKDENEVKSAGKDIIKYRIEEAELDSNGEPIMDKDTGRPRWTGKTLEWTIKAGETVEFPGYVADYLKKIYGFLQVVKSVKEEEVVGRVGEETGKHICKYCGKGFKRSRDLGLHMGLKHRDKIL